MTETIGCPYCGALNEIVVDESGGALQRYVEDCQVCCQPWEVTIRVGDDASDVDVQVRTLDE